MKRKGIFTFVSAALFAGAMTTPSFAQWGRPAVDPDITTNMVSSFDHYMDTHPADGQVLRQNPSLINDQRFINNHPALGSYLDQHPGLAREFSEHPNQFMHAENNFQHSYANTRGDDAFTGLSPSAKWNQFLDNNRDFARRYRENPNIINDPAIMAQEPGLREFLNNHPDVRAMVYARNDRSGYGNQGQHDDDDSQALNDQYLVNHPRLAKQLRDNPSLINNPEWVRSHPHLGEYLRNHPEARY